jgi:ureidoacrylate peracid hydrolase
MADVTFNKQLTVLMVIDPYNDFISEGGKVWNRLKSIAEANNGIPHMLQVLKAARKAAFASSTRCILNIVLATSRPGNTLPPFRRVAWKGTTFK